METADEKEKRIKRLEETIHLQSLEIKQLSGANMALKYAQQQVLSTINTICVDLARLSPIIKKE